MSKRAVIYARVSTDDQADNSSVDSQTAACRLYIAQHDLIEVGAVADVISGAKLDRPGLDYVREQARMGAINALVVYCPDRLTRSLAHSLLLRDEFKAANVVVYFVTQGENQHTPEGDVFESIETAFAEYERVKIAERMARGRKAALEQGKVLAGHAPPFGYVYAESGVLAIDEETAAVIRMIYGWYLEGMGAPAIIDRLASLQIPSPADRRAYNLRPKSKRGAAQWCTTTILHFLRNELYAGRYAIRHGNETIVVPVPPIIDDATWTAVAQIRAKRKRFSGRSATYRYLLRGRVRCARCDTACTGTVINGKKAWAQRYYVCLRKHHHTIHFDERGRCPMPGFRCDALESAVWVWIDQSVLNDAHIRARTNTRADISEDARTRLERERAVYTHQIENVDAQIGRLAQLFTAGLFQVDEIGAQKGQLDAVKASCQKEIVRLDGLLAGMRSITGRVDELTALVQRVRATGNASLTDDMKHTIIDLLDLHVKIDVDKAGNKYANVVCKLTLDETRLLVMGVNG
jgi:site-specific DNA recombinase